MHVSVEQQSTASSHISPETSPFLGELRPGQGVSSVNVNCNISRSHVKGVSII